LLAMAERVANYVEHALSGELAKVLDLPMNKLREHA
jgi:hypothetical protein